MHLLAARRWTRIQICSLLVWCSWLYSAVDIALVSVLCNIGLQITYNKQMQGFFLQSLDHLHSICITYSSCQPSKYGVFNALALETKRFHMFRGTTKCVESRTITNDSCCSDLSPALAVLRWQRRRRSNIFKVVRPSIDTVPVYFP